MGQESTREGVEKVTKPNPRGCPWALIACRGHKEFQQGNKKIISGKMLIAENINNDSKKKHTKNTVGKSHQKKE